MSNTGHVFISYSSKDNFYVDKIEEMLIDNNIPFWRASRHIPAGSSYAREIPKAIGLAAVFLLVISKNSQESMWVEKEIDSAVCQRKIVLPVCIDNMPLNETYRFYLNNVQIIPYREKFNLITQELRECLLRILSAEPAGEDMIDMPSEVNVVRNRVESYRLREQEKKINALNMNKAPVFCDYCGGKVTRLGRGQYVCSSCGRENYDELTKVKNYIESHRCASMVEVHNDTGVSLATIKYFLSQDYLQVSNRT